MSLSLGIGSLQINSSTMIERLYLIFRLTGFVGDLKVTSSTADAATSVGVVNINQGGTVEILDGKTWSIQ